MQGCPKLEDEIEDVVLDTPENKVATTAEGIPFLDNPGPLKAEEQSRVKYGGKVSAKTFNTAIPEQLEEYTKIIQKIVDGKSQGVGQARVIPNSSGDGWLLFLVYVDVYAMSPNKHNRLSDEVKSDTPISKVDARQLRKLR